MSATVMRRGGVRGWVRDPAGRFSWLKTATLTLILLPALILLARALGGDLGARPWTEATHVSGLWGIRILLVSLMVTPARQVIDSTRVVILRRMLGVAAACYIGLHFLLYVGDQDGDLIHVASEIVSRFYLAIGFIAFLGLLTLAVTSTNGWQRRLGKRWKRLHRVVYGLTALGLLHYFFQSKLDITNATLLAGVFVWLMLWRLEPRTWQLRNWPLPELAIIAALLTALIEAAWYAVRNGVAMERVLLANLDVGQSLQAVAAGFGAVGDGVPVSRVLDAVSRYVHPSAYILAAGLAVAVLALARPPWRRKPDPAAAAARAARRAARFETAE